jgi:hypothetical protein
MRLVNMLCLAAEEAALQVGDQRDGAPAIPAN